MQGGAHGFAMNMISEHTLPQLMCASQLPPSSEELLFSAAPSTHPPGQAARLMQQEWPLPFRVRLAGHSGSK